MPFPKQVTAILTLDEVKFLHEALGRFVEAGFPAGCEEHLFWTMHRDSGCDVDYWSKVGMFWKDADHLCLAIRGSSGGLARDVQHVAGEVEG